MNKRQTDGSKAEKGFSGTTAEDHEVLDLRTGEAFFFAVPGDSGHFFAQEDFAESLEAVRRPDDTRSDVLHVHWSPSVHVPNRVPVRHPLVLETVIFSLRVAERLKVNTSGNRTDRLELTDKTETDLEGADVATELFAVPSETGEDLQSALPAPSHHRFSVLVPERDEVIG